MNEVSIIINGVRYDSVKGLSCPTCAFDKDCNVHMVNLCNMLGVNDCGFKKSDKKMRYEKYQDRNQR